MSCQRATGSATKSQTNEPLSSTSVRRVRDGRATTPLIERSVVLAHRAFVRLGLSTLDCSGRRSSWSVGGHESPVGRSGTGDSHHAQVVNQSCAAQASAVDVNAVSGVPLTDVVDGADETVLFLVDPGTEQQRAGPPGGRGPDDQTPQVIDADGLAVLVVE